MPQKTIQLSFFIALTICLFVLLFFIARSYLGIIFISGVLSVIFYPLYQKFLFWFGNKEGLASVLTVFVIIVAVVIPIIFISAGIFKEAVGLYNSIVFEGGTQKIIIYADSISSKLGHTIFVENYIKDVLNWIIGHFKSVFSTIFKSLLGFVLMIISVYYLLRNGSRIKEKIIAWSPLPDNYDEEFLQNLKYSVEAVLRGRILVSIVQGIFIGIGFVIFGVGSPVLWGFVGTIASLVPILGTSIVIVPAVTYLFLYDNFGAGVGLLIWGALAVGLIDNFISAIFLKDKIKVHPLIILFSIFGGVEVFGVIGFLVGPVIVSAFIALMKIYPFIVFHKKQETQM